LGSLSATPSCADLLPQIIVNKAATGNVEIHRFVAGVFTLLAEMTSAWVNGDLCCTGSPSAGSSSHGGSNRKRPSAAQEGARATPVVSVAVEQHHELVALGHLSHGSCTFPAHRMADRGEPTGSRRPDSDRQAAMASPCAVWFDQLSPPS
jgi:hypothetical protein